MRRLAALAMLLLAAGCGGDPYAPPQPQEGGGPGPSDPPAEDCSLAARGLGDCARRFAVLDRPVAGDTVAQAEAKTQANGYTILATCCARDCPGPADAFLEAVTVNLEQLCGNQP